MSQKQTPNYTFALIVVFIVCFLIGFVTTMNNSMIAFCSEAFNLNAQQGQYVNSAFYGAYAFAIPFSLLMSKIGYKSTMILGLAVVGIGFIINSLGIKGVLDQDQATIYAVFLCSMTVVALGIVMLQNVANPYVMVLGSPEKGAFRMTLSQALNSVATTVAPIFITTVIIAGQTPTPEAVPGPFLGLGIFTLVIAGILVALKLPKIDEGKQAEEATGMLPYRLQALGQNDTSIITNLLMFYWGGMMVGRFVGAGILTKFKPRTLLTACIALGALCIVASLLASSSMIGIYLMLAAGLFHSVMWPLVFNLGLQELGPHTKAASGVINVGVIGAATLMPIMGAVVDAAGVIIAMCLMFVYYAYLFWFCNFGSKIGLNIK